MLFTLRTLVSCFHILILTLVSFTHSSEKLKFLSWFFVQPHNADMALCTIPAALAAPKPATTGTRLALATNPVWPAATVRLTWCSARVTVLNPCPALAGDPSDSGDPADFILSAGERPKTHLTGGLDHLWTLHALGEWEVQVWALTSSHSSSRSKRTSSSATSFTERTYEPSCSCSYSVSDTVGGKTPTGRSNEDWKKRDLYKTLILLTPT